MRPDSRSRRRELVLAPGRTRASNAWPQGGGQINLPVDDNAATLSDYAEVVVEANGDLREDLVVRRRLA
jgi:hypothetical protein